MFCIYADNFRGFQKSFITIKKVNFLVGENSTGKTSILGLINLFASPDFWIRQQFNNDRIKFGSFNDIVSSASSNKKFFRIGMLECADNITKEKIKNVFMCSMKFVREAGVPVMDEFKYVNGHNDISIIFSKTSAKYRIRKIEYGESICNDLLKLFNKWSDEEDTSENYISLKTKIPYMRNFLVIASTIIDRRITKGDDKVDESRSFNLKLPDINDSFTWIAPIRSKPKRTYDELNYDPTPEGDHIPYVIRQMLSKPKKAEILIKAIESFGEESHLLKSISIRQFDREPDSPFELNIKLEDKPISIECVGYGVSQSLPILVEIMMRRKNTWYAIQQPEVHLHPRAQAALGDMIYKIAKKDNKNFMIETHSDYIIDRFRINCMRNGSSKDINAQVLFFERERGVNIAHSIDIKENGDYSENQPKSFRDFFIKEQLDLLGIE